MKKITILITGVFLFFIAIIAFSSCKKDTASSEENTAARASALTSEAISKINTWLEKQKKAASLTGISRIQSLKESLAYSLAMTRDLRRSDSILIIPINKGYETAINKERSPVNMLVIFFNEQKEIDKGYIVQYISTRKFADNTALLNFMFDYYDFRDTRFSGSLAYLTVADEFSYELNYENGAYRYYKSTGKKPMGGLTETCFEVGFYYFWSDGSVTWQPIGSFCDNCEPAKTIHGRTYKINCGGGGGGGPEEPALTKELWWEVYREVATGPEPHIEAGVQFWGRKVSGESQGGHFTQANDHGISTFNFDMYGMNFVSGYSQSWHGTQNAYQAVQGTITYPPYTEDPLYIHPTKTFQFGEVFP